jgi:hypothetical protein
VHPASLRHLLQMIWEHAGQQLDTWLSKVLWG